MHTGHHTSATPPSRRDDGFTLVELLIVIVILGILATVTVFAVRGITDQGQENSEATDLRAMETAIESYYALNQTNPPDADALLAANGGLLADASTLHTYTVNGDGSFTITNTRTGLEVGSGAATSGTTTGTTLPPALWSGTPGNLGSFPMVTHGSGADTAVFIADAATRAVWNAQIDAGNIIVPGLDITYLIVDSADVPDLVALEALIVAADLIGAADMMWVTDDANTSAFCNDGFTDLDTRQCVEFGAGNQAISTTVAGVQASDFLGVFTTP